MDNTTQQPNEIKQSEPQEAADFFKLDEDTVFDKSLATLQLSPKL